MHESVRVAISRLTKEGGAKPYLWQIEEFTKLPSQALKAQIKDYPEELMISLNEKKILDIWHDKITIVEMSETLEMSYNTLRKVYVRLVERGLISPTKKPTKREPSGKERELNKCHESLTYVEILADIEVGGIKLLGARGYVTSNRDTKIICRVFQNGISRVAKVETGEYRVIGA